MKTDNKPRLAITMGDPTGIGPEVVVGAWVRPETHAAVRPLAIAHPEILRRAAALLNAKVAIVEVDDSAVATGAWDSNTSTIACLSIGQDTVLDAKVSLADAHAGELAYRCVVTATELALLGHIEGLATAPLSKAALHAAAHFYPGHTELLAELCGVKDFAMMLYLPAGSLVRGPGGLGVAHVTLHQSLRTIFHDINTTSIATKCRLADQVMRRLGVVNPRIAVAALNPHAGEGGLFGDEELEIIAPAVEAARSAGIDAAGPFPTDSLMPRARDGEFDAVVAMYHDQGHIALKLLDMQSAVNITLGLPIVRTSVAHGTAFDRAWQGLASCDGMLAAVTTAAKLIANKAS
jgi:4-hydroxythreonine-4-phosphate dehydrogenase